MLLIVSIVLSSLFCQRKNLFEASTKKSIPVCKTIHSLNKNVQVNDDEIVIGPIEFVREKGKPKKIITEFSVDNIIDSYYMFLSNGDPNENKMSLVTGAFIILNGDTVIYPEDLGREVYELTLDITLNYQNILDVKLLGKPNTQLSITVYRKFISPKDMVYVPAGEFIMGCNSDASVDNPEHEVYLDAFWIDKYEVTNAQYVTYLTEELNNGNIQANSNSVVKDGFEILDLDGPYCRISYSGGMFHVDSGKEDCPVVQVTWYGANSYAQYYDKRLPAEAEWEKAARGTDKRDFPWGNEIPTPSSLHCNMFYSGGTTPVGSFSPKGDSPYGCADMAGNAWEWCADWYGRFYYNQSPYENPTGPTGGTYRMLRGGNWHCTAPYSVHVSYRNYSVPGGYYTSLSEGFRCVKSVN